MQRTDYKVSAADAKSISVRILRIFLVLLVANLILAHVINPFPISGFQIRVFNLWHSEKAPDIVFMGSSATRENLDELMVAEKLSSPGKPVTAVNMGITGGGAIAGRAILKHIMFSRIDRGDFGSPKLWVFEYHPMELTPEFNFAGPMAQVNDVRKWADKYDKLDSVGGVAVDTLRHGMGPYQRVFVDKTAQEMVFNRIPTFSLAFDWPNNDKIRRMVRSGLASVGIGHEADTIQAAQRFSLGSLKNYEIADTSVAAIGDMIKIVQKRGGKVVIMGMALSDHSGISKGVQKKFKEAIESVATPLGVPFYQLTTKDCGLTNADYFDFIHVMREARPKVTSCVMDTVLKNNYEEYR